MRKVQITKLKTPYVSVEGSYGGNQGWFKPAEGATGKDSRGLSVRKAKTLEGFGCGLIGGSDIILHLLGRSVLSNGSDKGYFKVRTEDNLESGSAISKKEYENYILQMEKKFFHILPKLGISGVLLALNFNIYFFLNRKNIRKKTGYSFLARWGVLPGNILIRIKEMLSEDIPVIISIGPGFFHSNKLNFYNKIEKMPDDNKPGKASDAKTYLFKPVTKTKDHYVTVTGVEEYPTVDGSKIMLEISSWGKKYYVNFAEYLEYVKKNDNFYFSNILYIRKKW